ncbi:Gfa-like protein [hydrothermal vent metagenome]|uniref:Gfa-like protein n=1 Tax=hydrothermal vent metagenome TaxID=652676 RepID=A0A3B0VX26_9ZZZZ
MYKGSCLCGSIQFEVTRELGKSDACHCVQCRKWTGHFLPSTEVKREALQIESKAELKWYQSSGKVRRGFCAQCGSSLFFDPIDQSKHNWIAIALGAFDQPTQVKLGMHIFVAEKGDYYELNDGLPQNQH